MLNVSPFSDFAEECERLFLNETLIICDIMVTDNVSARWMKMTKYIEAITYFEKIMYGEAGDDNWNISESEQVQDTLVDVILSHIYHDLQSEQRDDNHLPEEIH